MTSDDLIGTVKAALDDPHGWNWSSLLSGEWTWKPSCVRDWLRALVAEVEALREKAADRDALWRQMQSAEAARLREAIIVALSSGGYMTSEDISTLLAALEGEGR